MVMIYPTQMYNILSDSALADPANIGQESIDLVASDDDAAPPSVLPPLLPPPHQARKGMPQAPVVHEYRYERVRRFSHKWSEGMVLFETCDLLFIPINTANAHWTLVVVDFKAKQLQYYDSFHH